MVKTLVTKITSVIASEYAGRGRMLTEKGHRELWVDGNVLSLNGVMGYIGTMICENQ